MPALFLVFFYALNLALFLLPGFSLALALRIRRRISAACLVMIVVATGAVLGYTSFWCFFAGKALGKAFTFATYTAATAIVGFVLFRSTEARTVVKQIISPLLFVFLAGICYLSVFYLFDDVQKHEAGLANVRFFEQGRPGDNLIPLIFADRIYNHQPLRPFCCGDWLSSDRPPLQSGIFLLIRPLRLGGSLALQYQALSTGLQCLWICGVWTLLTTIGTPESRIRQVLALMIPSGFLFYNSVFVWPKLLGAAFILFAVTVFFQAFRAGSPIGIVNAVLGAVSLGLALLAHPGSVFSLFAVGLLACWMLIRRPGTFGFRQMALATFVLGILLLPWRSYQKFVDPPGNRLLKMHLAGVMNIDQRSVGKALRDVYRHRTWSEILKNKYTNLRMLVGPKPWDALGGTALRVNGGLHVDHAIAEGSRTAQREYIWSSVGLLNLGWLALVISKIKRRADPAIPFAGWLIVAAILNLLLWSLVLFGPSATFTTHSSYADIILLCVALSGWLLVLPRVVAISIFVLQVFNLLVVWGWSLPKTYFPAGAALQVPFLILALLCIGVLLAIFVHESFKPSGLREWQQSEAVPAR